MSLILGNTVISGITTPLNGSIAIGQIISSIIPLSDAGLHLLDGSLIQGGGIYNAFVQYIANLVNLYPQCFTDETTWQNTVNSKGVCGKFVYDSVNNTVRLPKITGFIEGTVDIGALGDLVNAGLPNIIGNVWAGGNYGSSIFTSSYGAFQNSSNSGWRTSTVQSTVSGASDTITFDASRSNSIYGNSNTVQPQSIKVFYYIVIATNTKTDIEVDIDEVITDLNSKANDVDVVHKIGNESIDGVKTFNHIQKLNGDTLKCFNFARGTNPSSTSYTNYYMTDSTGVSGDNTAFGLFRTQVSIDGSVRTSMRVFKNNISGTNQYADIGLLYPSTGEPSAYAPASDVTNSIVTTVSKNKTTRGHFQLGNGLIVNWGTMNAGDNQNITFSKAFSGTNYGLCLTYNVNASGSSYGFAAKIKSKSSTGFVGYGDAFSLWIAIGY